MSYKFEVERGWQRYGYDTKPHWAAAIVLEVIAENEDEAHQKAKELSTNSSAVIHSDNFCVFRTKSIGELPPEPVAAVVETLGIPSGSWRGTSRRRISG